MIHILTGDGKGKTSAAVGMALRMRGAGGRVLFAQFLKGSDSGEVNILRNIGGIDVARLSKNYGFVKSMSAADKESVKREHDAILSSALCCGCDMIILDEIIPALNTGLADETLVDKILSLKCEIVLTGRAPSARLAERADYISEIKKIKHPFDRGIAARRGVEF